MSDLEPGMVIKTGGKVPLRFIAMARHRGGWYVYCTARMESRFIEDMDDFISLEDANYFPMTKQEIESEIGPYAASVAEGARKSYLRGEFQ